MVTQMMHWITVALVLLAWFLGQFDDIFPKGAARAGSLFVHISAGLGMIGFLFCAYFGVLLIHHRPLNIRYWANGSTWPGGSLISFFMRC